MIVVVTGTSISIVGICVVFNVVSDPVPVGFPVSVV